MYQFKKYTEQDILDLINPESPQEEGLMLDYKGALWLNKQENPHCYNDHKLKLAESASGFANASGAVIIVGVDEVKKTKELKLNGILSEKAIDIETIDRIIKDNLSPTLLGVEAHVIPLSESKPGYVCLAIQIPMSYDGPHMLLHDCRYYRRVGTSHIRMDHNMVMDVLNRFKLPSIEIDLGSAIRSVAPNGDLRLNISSGTVKNTGRVTAKNILFRVSLSRGWNIEPFSSDIKYTDMGFFGYERSSIYPELEEKFPSIALNGAEENLDNVYLKIDVVGDNLPIQTLVFRRSNETSRLELVPLSDCPDIPWHF